MYYFSRREASSGTRITLRAQVTKLRDGSRENPDLKPSKIFMEAIILKPKDIFYMILE
jgi:hypothetical protein